MPRRARTGRSRHGPQLRWDAASLRALPEQLTRYFEDHFAFRVRLVRWQAIVRGCAGRLTVRVGHQGQGRLAVLCRRRRDGGLRGGRRRSPAPSSKSGDTRCRTSATGCVAKGLRIYSSSRPISTSSTGGCRPRSGAQLLPESTSWSLTCASTPPSACSICGRRSSPLSLANAFTIAPTLTGTTAVPSSATRASSMLCRRNPHQIGFPQRVRTARRAIVGSIWLGCWVSPSAQRGRSRAGPQAPCCSPHPRAAVSQPPAHARIVTEARTADRVPLSSWIRSAGLVPFLSEDFSRVVYLWQDNMDPQVVQQERPQVVIQELVGRALTTHFPYNPVPRVSAIDPLRIPSCGRRRRFAATSRAEQRDLLGMHNGWADRAPTSRAILPVRGRYPMNRKLSTVALERTSSRDLRVTDAGLLLGCADAGGRAHRHQDLPPRRPAA